MFCNNGFPPGKARRTPLEGRTPTGPISKMEADRGLTICRETASIIPTSRPGFAKCGTSTKIDCIKSATTGPLAGFG